MWQGFPIKVDFTIVIFVVTTCHHQVDVPTDRILLGCKGASSSATIKKLTEKSVRQDLLGVMVWFCRFPSDIHNVNFFTRIEISAQNFTPKWVNFDRINFESKHVNPDLYDALLLQFSQDLYVCDKKVTQDLVKKITQYLPFD